jgi:hypothetical protein
MSQEGTVVGVYVQVDSAEDAVRVLGEGGFPLGRVSVIARDLGSEKKVHGFIASCNGVRRGAWAGGLCGLLVGVAFLWLPGVGPLVVAGSLTARFLGGLEGAVAGAGVTGFLGWLTPLGLSEQHIRRYEERVQSGKYLVIAHGSAAEIKKARKVLQGSGAAELHVYGQGV